MAILDQSQVAGSTLGYAQITANATTSSNTAVQVSGLTLTVTIPAGGRRVKITGYVWAITSSTNAASGISIWDGAVGTGTQISKVDASAATNVDQGAVCIAVQSPAPGSKTYNIGFNTASGTMTLNASTIAPAFILVELI